MSRPNLRDRHLYILISLFIACTFIYYFGELVNFFGWEAFHWNIWYTVHDPHRLLFLVPILYCSYYYSVRGALLSNVISLLIFLPRALFISPFPDPTLRMIIFVLFSTALSTLMALVLINMDKRVELPDQVRPVKKKYQNMPLTLLLIFVFMSAGILVAGYIFYSNYEKNYRAQRESQLSSITDLKAEELMQWRKERLGDANQFSKNPAFSSLVQRYFEHPDDLYAQEQLMAWLAVFQANYQYARAVLLDTQGVGRIVVPETGQSLSLHMQKNAQLALQSGKVTILDLHRDEEGERPHMTVLIPLFREKDGNPPLGVVVLLIDPETYLYPLINSWPTASTTAETLIVRRDGNDALYLNGLKFRKDAALKLRTPLDRTDVPAVMAVLGQEGIVEGRDYRGVQVLADLRPIPDSPWFMVARMDISEVFAPLTQVLWMVIALVSALLIGAGASISLLWRQQNIRDYKERAEIAEALSDSEIRYRDLFENASLAVFRSTLDGKLLIVNPKFASIFGYKSQTEVVATIKDIATDLYVDPHRHEEIALLKENNSALNKFEALYRRRDASTFWGELTLNIITDSSGATFFEGFIEDITERKRAELALLEANERIKLALEASKSGAWDWDMITGQLTWSDEQFRIFGLDPSMDAASFETWRTSLHPDDRQVAEDRISESIRDHVRLYNQYRIILPGGEVHWIEAWGDTRYDGMGVARRMNGICIDITELKQAEDKLLEREQLYHSLFQNMLNGFAYCRMFFENGQPQDFIYIAVNSAFEKHTGLKNVIGRKVSEVIPGIYETDRELIETYGRVATTGITESFEIYLSALKMWFSISVYSPQKEHFMVVFDVITERKQSEEKLLKSYETLKKTLNDAISTMVKIVELRDPYTAGHQQKVADLATAIAREMKFEDMQIDELRTAAVIHDIGKIYVPSDILSKPGKLTDIELNLIRTHAQNGYDIVKGMELPGAVAETILQHHERLDGSGYPNGLRAEDTLMKAKILAVADVVEAMASHRPYRSALGIDKALVEISKNKGRLYDPDVVDACRELFNSGKFEFKSV